MRSCSFQEKDNEGKAKNLSFCSLLFMERTLVDEPFEKEQGMPTEKWGDLCAKDDIIYENISDDEVKNSNQSPEATDTERIERMLTENELSNNNKMPVLNVGIPLDSVCFKKKLEL